MGVAERAAVNALAVLAMTDCTIVTQRPMGSDDNQATGGALVPTGTWTNVTSNLAGIPSECGNLSGMSVKPDEDLVIAGIAQKGLYATSNGGGSWAALGTGAGSDTILNRMTGIVYDPSNLQKYWEYGLYDGNAAFSTVDDGSTFQSVGDIDSIDLLSIDFSDPDRKTMLAGGHEVAPTPRLSTDSGMTWKEIGSGLPEATHCTFPLLIDRRTFLVGCAGYGGSPSGIYRSTDAGSTWALATALGGADAPLMASDGSIYWVSPGNGGVTRSTDNGQTWTLVGGVNQIAGPRIVALPNGGLASLGDQYVMFSSNQGATWAPATSAFPFASGTTVTDLVYSAAEKAFFIWYFTCGSFDGSPVPVPDDAIARYDFNPGSP